MYARPPQPHPGGPHLHPFPTPQRAAEAAQSDSPSRTPLHPPNPSHPFSMSQYTFCLPQSDNFHGLSSLLEPHRNMPPDLEPEIESLRSDEIGGPEDFTLNMVEWFTNMPRSPVDRQSRQHGQNEQPQTQHQHPDSASDRDSSSRTQPRSRSTSSQPSTFRSRSRSRTSRAESRFANRSFAASATASTNAPPPSTSTHPGSANPSFGSPSTKESITSVDSPEYKSGPTPARPPSSSASHTRPQSPGLSVSHFSMSRNSSHTVTSGPSVAATATTAMAGARTAPVYASSPVQHPSSVHLPELRDHHTPAKQPFLFPSDGHFFSPSFNVPGTTPIEPPTGGAGNFVSSINNNNNNRTASSTTAGTNASGPDGAAPHSARVSPLIDLRNTPARFPISNLRSTNFGSPGPRSFLTSTAASSVSKQSALSAKEGSLESEQRQQQHQQLQPAATRHDNNPGLPTQNRTVSAALENTSILFPSRPFPYSYPDLSSEASAAVETSATGPLNTSAADATATTTAPTISLPQQPKPILMPSPDLNTPRPAPGPYSAITPDIQISHISGLSEALRNFDAHNNMAINNNTGGGGLALAQNEDLAPAVTAATAGTTTTTAAAAATGMGAQPASKTTSTTVPIPSFGAPLQQHQHQHQHQDTPRPTNLFRSSGSGLGLSKFQFTPTGQSKGAFLQYSNNPIHFTPANQVNFLHNSHDQNHIDYSGDNNNNNNNNLFSQSHHLSRTPLGEYNSRYTGPSAGPAEFNLEGGTPENEDGDGEEDDDDDDDDKESKAIYLEAMLDAARRETEALENEMMTGVCQAQTQDVTRSPTKRYALECENRPLHEVLHQLRVDLHKSWKDHCSKFETQEQGYLGELSGRLDLENEYQKVKRANGELEASLDRKTETIRELEGRLEALSLRRSVVRDRVDSDDEDDSDEKGGPGRAGSGRHRSGEFGVAEGDDSDGTAALKEQLTYTRRRVEEVCASKAETEAKMAEQLSHHRLEMVALNEQLVRERSRSEFLEHHTRAQDREISDLRATVRNSAQVQAAQAQAVGEIRAQLEFVQSVLRAEQARSAEGWKVAEAKEKAVEGLRAELESAKELVLRLRIELSGGKADRVLDETSRLVGRIDGLAAELAAERAVRAELEKKEAAQLKQIAVLEKQVEDLAAAQLASPTEVGGERSMLRGECDAHDDDDDDDEDDNDHDDLFGKSVDTFVVDSLREELDQEREHRKQAEIRAADRDREVVRKQAELETLRKEVLDGSEKVAGMLAAAARALEREQATAKTDDRTDEREDKTEVGVGSFEAMLAEIRREFEKRRRDLVRGQEEVEERLRAKDRELRSALERLRIYETKAAEPEPEPKSNPDSESQSGDPSRSRTDHDGDSGSRSNPSSWLPLSGLSETVVNRGAAGLTNGNSKKLASAPEPATTTATATAAAAAAAVTTSSASKTDTNGVPTVGHPKSEPTPASPSQSQSQSSSPAPPSSIGDALTKIAALESRLDRQSKALADSSRARDRAVLAAKALQARVDGINDLVDKKVAAMIRARDRVWVSKVG